ncbi:MAG: CDP-alcohol phosphatidyltransferase family protein [Acidobacteria bacterium]|nr:CDP-alcohol phosphatidyltransferase family protein [Acidobacteriota bacterium]
MIDARARIMVAPVLARVAGRLDRRGVSPDALTLAGVGAGLLSVGAILLHWWWIALGGWWANRVLDGLDGALARRRTPSEIGGYLDLVADFFIYGALVGSLGYAIPSARVASLFLLVAYYLSGTALLAGSAIIARRGAPDEERSLIFLGGLAEGTETIVAMSLIMVHPGWAVPVEVGFGVMVMVTFVQRVAGALSILRTRDVTGGER